jgi:hypothetical protein
LLIDYQHDCSIFSLTAIAPQMDYREIFENGTLQHFQNLSEYYFDGKAL